MQDYAEMNDEFLVQLFQDGDGEASEFLMKKYRSFVRAKASRYFLIGGEREDIVQEGMIGLYKAIRDFRVDKLSSFKAFAELCITRQIITAVKSATRQKHGPLNSYVSLNKPIYEEESNHTLMDVITGPTNMDPIQMLIDQEKASDLERKMSEKLSDLEKRVLELHIAGHSYVEISQNVNTHVKSIDNALQRIKRKMERYLERKEAVL
ncbi:RNA polymerase sporulation sigma factor SigH [Mesobacillus maritimus]|uniref:RNA polymerase sporulation sigma factor SigH n=2 Tax=Mesobacillus maritimus TaxID=1643336 RepID=A0ABS7JZV5_9BACI|nr:RNA polymerase sporulation sigma factor SigH [Mesobacillus maritimus]MBY0095522.1 RNA polymerase sporulation sigma factor SigH [Mesobacillus maritimus]